MQIEVVEGDITALEVDAIANAANDRLWMGGGVAGAIKRAGGTEIENEATAKGPIPLGTAVETGAGRLPIRYVIHGAVMGQDLQTTADLVAQTTRSCLALADELGAETLALPAFGTGVGGFPLEEAAEIMVREARAIRALVAPARRVRRLRAPGRVGLRRGARGRMKGVILAGGSGTRLHPLTRITNKHLLPIYDRPMVTYAIEALVRAGITELMLVTGGTHAGEFLRLLGNGHEWGIDRLSYAYQERAGGIAEALGLAERFAAGDRICVMLADNVVERSIRADGRELRAPGAAAPASCSPARRIPSTSATSASPSSTAARR